MDTGRVLTYSQSSHHQHRGHTSSRFSSNSDAFASEFLENLGRHVSSVPQHAPVMYSTGTYYTSMCYQSQKAQ